MTNRTEAIKTLNIGTTEIQYSEHGHREPLLLIHGGLFADWFVPLAAIETLRMWRATQLEP